MNLIQLLALLLPKYDIYDKSVLKDYPGCGQLGDPGKKECFWHCEWGPNPLDGINHPLFGLNETRALALIEDKLEDLVGKNSASCLLKGFKSATTQEINLSIYQEQYDNGELVVIKFFYDIIDIIYQLGPVSVKSPACLKNCEGVELCAQYAESLTNHKVMIPKVFNKQIYGSKCARVLKKKRDELEMSGLLSRIHEEMSFHLCLSGIIYYIDIGRLRWVFENCIASLFSDVSKSCFKKLRKNKRKHKFGAKILRETAKKLNKRPERIIGHAGDSIFLGLTEERLNKTLNQYPWTCSLKTRGFRGYHRCGVTLLSAPPQKTILVSAAHCNFICKASDGFPVETCCCRDVTDINSCKKFNSYCGPNPSLQLANPEDLNIVCGEWDTGTVAERFTPEEEVVLTVLEFKNHPLFNVVKGPVGGHDLSVYFVDDKPLRNGAVQKGKLYPACLPSKTQKNQRGIFSGWRDPIELGAFFKGGVLGLDIKLDEWRKEFVLNHIAIENVTCKDPPWMGSDSFYPAGTICAVDQSKGSCFTTGDSGSGFFMEMQGEYSWEGTLSSYRGCSTELISTFEDTPSIVVGGRFVGENPGVFTQGSCYLQWIADSYDLRLAEGSYGTGCRAQSGDRKDLDKKDCAAANGKKCIIYKGYVINPFNPLNKCNLAGNGFYGVQMVYRCQTFDNTLFAKCKKCREQQYSDLCKKIETATDIDKVTMKAYLLLLVLCEIDLIYTRSTCANNCPGVRASDIVVGGATIFSATALATNSLTAPLLSLLGIGVVGLGGGGLIIAGQMCAGPLYCRVRGTCCLLVASSAGLQCPSNC